jgi:APA family basic amino acid/polyamine antiporter
MATEPIKSPQGTFLRPSSGLVKAAGLVDVFIFNVGIISIGIGILYVQRYGPAYYPNGNIILATTIATLLMTFVALGFWAWTATIPRSGGIYVFLTRSRVPGIGFALSFVECISWLFYAALAATLMVSAGFWPLAALLFGTHSVLADWLGTSLAKLIIGSAVIWIAAYLLIRGTKSFFTIQKIIFVLALVGTVALLYVLSNSGAVEIYLTNINAALQPAGVDVIKQAASMGQPQRTVATLAETMAFVVWPFLPLIGAAFSLVLAGETQNNQRNQLLGMIGSLIFAACILTLAAYLNEHSIGTNIQGALAYLYDNGKETGMPGEPYLSYFAGLATNQPLLRVLIPIGFVAWIWFWIPGVLAYTERAFLAWSLDRAAPAFLAELHPVRATPYLAVITGAVITEAFLVLILYTEFFATLVFVLVGASAWCITLAIGAFFPILGGQIYEMSPLSERRVLGVPLMSLLCGAGAGALAIVVYLLWNDPIAAGHSVKSLSAIAVTFGFGFIFYLVVKLWRARQGIDISNAFREIPVE